MAHCIQIFSLFCTNDLNFIFSIVRFMQYCIRFNEWCSTFGFCAALKLLFARKLFEIFSLLHFGHNKIDKWPSYFRCVLIIWGDFYGVNLNLLMYWRLSILRTVCNKNLKSCYLLVWNCFNLWQEFFLEQFLVKILCSALLQVHYARIWARSRPR